MNKKILITGLLIISTGVYVSAQSPEPLTAGAGKSATIVSDKDQNSKLPAFPTPTPAMVVQTTGSYVRPNSKTRLRRYVNSLVGPVALGKMVVTSGYSTWRNSPEEWGPHWEGFGRRVASSFGKNVIKQTTVYALDEALKVDSAYYRSKNKDFGSKVTNALISPFTARDSNGKRVLGVPKIAGTYASSVIAAEMWYPSRFDWKDGMKSGTISFGMNAAFNLVKEFLWKK